MVRLHLYVTISISMSGIVNTFHTTISIEKTAHFSIKSSADYGKGTFPILLPFACSQKIYVGSKVIPQYQHSDLSLLLVEALNLNMELWIWPHFHSWDLCHTHLSSPGPICPNTGFTHHSSETSQHMTVALSFLGSSHKSPTYITFLFFPNEG